MEPALSLDASPFYSRILRKIQPDEGYLFVIGNKPFRLETKREGRYQLQEVVLFKEHDPEVKGYGEQELAALLENGDIRIKDPEDSKSFLSHQVAGSVRPGDVVETVRSGSKRRVIEVLSNLGGIKTESLAGVPDRKPYDFNSVVTGVLAGIIKITRP